jgi:hypothetical protein
MSWDPLAEEEEPEPQVEVTLTNKRFPDGELKFVLQRIGEVVVSSVEDHIARMVGTYVTGDEIEGGEPQVFEHAGKRYRLNRPLIRNITYLLAMQRQETRHAFPYYLGLAKNFSAEFQQLRRAAWKLQEPLTPRPGEEALNPFAFQDGDTEDGSFDALLTSDNGTSTSKRTRTKTSVELPTP